jgi:NAD(P)-dependent dehydrogenase (short-subunit alcohol dehydrogenase family)
MNGKTPNTIGSGVKHVLITGCSSGIGRQAAITLSARGFIVYATVRRSADADDLRTLNCKNLMPICPLDLTNLQHIKNVADVLASEMHKKEGRGLYALVNNAGGGLPSPLELMDLDMFKTEVNTRLVGSVALVQALLPLIRQGKGRIIWIATPALIPTPYVASIHACDFAVNCLARTLDIELKPWGIRNILIRCGGIKTAAGLRTTSDVKAVLRQTPPDRSLLYAKTFTKWGEDMARFDAKRSDPERVAQTILAALVAENPKHRYQVGHMARIAALLEALPQPISDWILGKRF